MALPTFSDVEAPDALGRTPLSLAAESGATKIVRLLLDHHNVDPNKPDAQGLTALSWATLRGQESIVDILLTSDKVKLDVTSAYGKSPLAYAMGRRSTTLLTKLLAKGANPNAQYAPLGFRLPSIFFFVSVGDTTNYLAYYFDSTGDMSPLLNLGNPPLDAHLSDIIVEFLGRATTIRQCNAYVKQTINTLGEKALNEVKIEYKRFPEEMNARSQTILHEVSGFGNVEAVRILLKAEGIQPNIVNALGHTALLTAVVRNWAEVVNILLDDDRVDVNIRDGSGRTAFELAKEEGYADIMTLLENHPRCQLKK